MLTTRPALTWVSNKFPVRNRCIDKIRRSGWIGVALNATCLVGVGETTLTHRGCWPHWVCAAQWGRRPLLFFRKVTTHVETFEPIKTSILVDPTITDAEMRLIVYLATKPPGWVVWDEDIRKSLDRSQNWVKETKAKLRRRGLLAPQPRTKGKFANSIGCEFARNSVVATVGGITAGGKTSCIDKTELVDKTEARVAVGGISANGTTPDDLETSTSVDSENRSTSSAGEPCPPEGTVDDGNGETSSSRGSPGTNAPGRPHARTREMRRGIHDLANIDHWWTCRPCKREVERRHEEDLADWMSMSETERRAYISAVPDDYP
jgi:hypothetical protein